MSRHLPFTLYEFGDQELRKLAEPLETCNELREAWLEIERNAPRLAYQRMAGKGFGIKSLAPLKKGEKLALMTGSVSKSSLGIFDNFSIELPCVMRDGSYRNFHLTCSREEGLPLMQSRAQQYNHRCKHFNCKFEKGVSEQGLGICYIVVEARRDLAEGEELTVNYGKPGRDSILMTRATCSRRISEEKIEAYFQPCLCADCEGRGKYGFLMLGAPDADEAGAAGAGAAAGGIVPSSAPAGGAADAASDPPRPKTYRPYQKARGRGDSAAGPAEVQASDGAAAPVAVDFVDLTADEGESAPAGGSAAGGVVSSSVPAGGAAEPKSSRPYQKARGGGGSAAGPAESQASDGAGAAPVVDFVDLTADDEGEPAAGSAAEAGEPAVEPPPPAREDPASDSSADEEAAGTSSGPYRLRSHFKGGGSANRR